MSHESFAQSVLNRYAVPLRGALTFLGNHGGFSGAQVWRVNAVAMSFCLKAWPTDGRPAAEVSWIHRLMAQAAHLPWMPRLAPTMDGATCVNHAGRLWELQTWVPGVADFAAQPSSARLQAVCLALAQLHGAWRSTERRSGICPAVERRWDSWRIWQQLVQSGWRPVVGPLDPFATLADSLWDLLQERIDEVPRLLTPWLTRPVALQPCVCDLWHDHVFFTGSEVTGLIDFGSVKVDHVAVDLARLLGSLIGSDSERWKIALAAYESLQPFSAEERLLAQDLDRTGTILAATHWLRWLYHDRRVYERPAAVVGRLEQLLGRLREIREYERDA